MKIGITYDIKEQYGFETLDLNFTDFLNAADVTFVKETLEKCGHYVFLIGNSQKLLQFLESKQEIDLVFNLSWGYRGRNREGIIPAILESYQIPYTGTDAFGCSLCLNKLQTKLIASFLNIPTPDFFIVTPNNKDVYKAAVPLSYPLVLKPNNEGTGMGVTLVNSDKEFYSVLQYLLDTYKEPILCESYIDGDEITVPMLEDENGLYAVGVLSILDTNGQPLRLYDASIKTSHKYIKQLSKLPEKVNVLAAQYSCDIYSLIQGRGYGRADFRISSDGTPYFLEMAPLPLLAPYSSFNLCTTAVGMSDENVLQQIIKSACKHYNISMD